MPIHSAEKWRLCHILPFVASNIVISKRYTSVDFLQYTNFRVLVEINAH